MMARVITALVLAPLLLALVIWAPPWLMQIAVGVIVLRGAYEWARFMQLSHRAHRWLYTGLILLLMVALRLSGGITVTSPVLWLASAWWLVALVWVLVYPRGLPVGQPAVWRVGTAGVLTLVPLWVAACALQDWPNDGAFRLIVCLMIVWAADIFAFVAGSALGKHKLAPRVSPGKSWEGLVGGLLGGQLIAAMGVFLAGMTPWLFAVALVLVPISVVGDLAESLFKRHSGVKDSGSIFPGHGGLMDRADSLAAAIPVFTLGMALAVGA